MDFDGAIRAHSDWKLKLSTYLRHPDGSLQSLDIQPDHKCALGKWIYGEGSVHSKLPEFSALAAAHARFHKAAAEVVTRANGKENVAEEIVLGSKSSYGIASSAVVLAILSMKAKV